MAAARVLRIRTLIQIGDHAPKVIAEREIPLSIDEVGRTPTSVRMRIRYDGKELKRLLRETRRFVRRST